MADSSNVVDLKTARAPSGLSAESRRLWTDITAQFEVDDAAGLVVLQQLCECLDRLRECQKAIAAEGTSVKGYRGQPRSHPLLKTEAECRRQMLACYRCLNLDPGPIE